MLLAPALVVVLMKWGGFSAIAMAVFCSIASKE